MSVEKQDTELTAEQKAEIWNRQACEMVSIFFKEIASMSADDIYKIASKEGEEGEGSELLLATINTVFAQFIENGEGLPRIYFDSYARTVDSIVHTFKLNITTKLELNSENLIKLAVAKPTEDISYTDIANAMTVPEVEDISDHDQADVPIEEVEETSAAEEETAVEKETPEVE